MPESLAPGMPASGEHEEAWIEIDVAVELHPWPNRDWLLFWQEEEFDWPKHFDEPLLDGRRLVFSAPEEDLERAGNAVKARVKATNEAYGEQFPQGEDEADR
jgi:hypothetical protein